MAERKVAHAQHLKAVNHPIRREMLRIVYETEDIQEKELIKNLINENIIEDKNLFTYHMDFLLQALCIEKVEEEGTIHYKILPGGRVIENF
ncbi:MAG: hypothetical protein ACFE8B_09405 [Candidatus Hermodarchaeota archaeon]